MADAASPTLSAPFQVPRNPMPNEEVKVIVNVTDDSGIREAVLSYRNVSVLINVSMAPIGNNIFSANITAMPYQTVVEYNYRLRQLQLSRKPRIFLLLHRHTRVFISDHLHSVDWRDLADDDNHEKTKIHLFAFAYRLVA